MPLAQSLKEHVAHGAAHSAARMPGWVRVCGKEPRTTWHPHRAKNKHRHRDTDTDTDTRDVCMHDKCLPTVWL